MKFHNPCPGRPGISSRPLALAMLLLALSGCATLQPDAAPPAPDNAMAAAYDYLRAGQAREAIRAFERAAAIDPTSKAPWLEIARLRVAQQRHVEALAAAEQVLRRDPGDPEAADIATGSGLQVALLTMKRMRASGQMPNEARSDQIAAIAALMAEAFDPALLVSEEARTRIAAEAVAHYQSRRAERLPEAQVKPKGDPLDLLGGD